MLVYKDSMYSVQHIEGFVQPRSPCINNSQGLRGMEVKERPMILAVYTEFISYISKVITVAEKENMKNDVINRAH